MKQLAVLVLTFLLAAGSTAAALSSQVACTGTAVDSDGAPVAAAEIRLYGVNNGKGPFRQQLVDVAYTDESGRFTIAAPYDDLKPFSYAAVAVFSEGLAVGWARWPLYDPLDFEVEITLGKPAAISGIVLDGADPVAGATVRALLKLVEDGSARVLAGSPRLDELSAVTGPDGRFRFETIPSDASVALVVSCDGFSTATDGLSRGSNPFGIEPGTQNIAVTLRPDVRIEGTLSDTAAMPLADVTVIAVPVAHEKRPFLTRESISGADGAFTFEGLAPGEYLLEASASAPGGEDLSAAPVAVTVETGEPIAVSIVLEPLCELSVTVTDAKTYKRLSGARIMLQARDGGAVEQLFTDENGVAVIRLPAGDYMIANVGADGYLSTDSQHFVTLAGGQGQETELNLDPAEFVRGVVVDPDGNPVAGAHVEVGPGGYHPGLRTDENGRFKAGWSFDASGRRGAPFVVARVPERGLAVRMPVGDVANEVTIKLALGIDLVGRVLGANGEPVPQATMTIAWRDDEYTPPVDPCIGVADEEGRWAFNALPDYAAYRVTAEAYGYGTGAVSVDLYGRSGEDVQADDIILEPADKVLSGTTVDSNGDAFPGVRVRLSGTAIGNLVVLSDDGTWRFEDLPAGRFDIMGIARLDGEVYASEETRVEVPADDVKLVMRLYSARREETGPARTASLLGAPLGALGAVAPTFDAATADGTPLLVVFLDINQRASRHVVAELAEAADKLAERAVKVLLIDESGATAEELAEWVEGTGAPFAAAALSGQPEEVHAEWGIQGLPWLILTDKDHVVRAEGFQIGELDDRLAKLAEE